MTTLTIREYLTRGGTSPFRTWLSRLDLAVGLGVWEARCAFGPGYRIYFARVEATVVLLLLGGSKSSQRSDIRTARRYWADYLEEHARGTPK